MNWKVKTAAINERLIKEVIYTLGNVHCRRPIRLLGYPADNDLFPVKFQRKVCESEVCLEPKRKS